MADMKREKHQFEASVRVIQQKPLETVEDYRKMIVYIGEIGEKAIKNDDLRLDLLQKTGMYTKSGKIKKDLVNV